MQREEYGQIRLKDLSVLAEAELQAMVAKKPTLFPLQLLTEIATALREESVPARAMRHQNRACMSPQ